MKSRLIALALCWPLLLGAGARDFGALSSDDATCGTGSEVDDLPLGNGMTLAIWVNVDTLDTTVRRIMSKSSDSVGDGWTWSADQNASNLRIAFEVAFSTSGMFWRAIDDITEADGLWQFLALSYDGDLTTNNPNFYRGTEAANVVLLTTDSGTDPTGTYDTDGAFNLMIGNRETTQDRAFDGRMAWAQVWHKTLTLAELRQAQWHPCTVVDNLVRCVPLWDGASPEQDIMNDGDCTIGGASAVNQGPPVLWGGSVF